MLDKDIDTDLDTDLDDDIADETESGPQAVTLATHAHASTPLDLARLGLSEFAYIRRALVNDVPMWTIHSAAGDPLGAAESFDLAWAAVRQNDLQPVRVH
ncbi:MAG: DUF1150 domain-containing protein [Rhodospirillaceae bacterium]|nr:DUF1150 domain-containing protein [Rhodospirillaceae bacterium]